MTHDQIKSNCAKLLATNALENSESAEVLRLFKARSYTKRDKVTVSELVRRYLS